MLSTLAALRDQTGLDIGPYHWGTLYDMLGYSASGSVIDYFNTPDVIGGYGFATELTAGGLVNRFVHVPLLNQVHVDAIRAINTTMFKQALDPVRFTYTVGGRAAYLFDPQRVRSDDSNGVGFAGDPDDARVATYGQRRVRRDTHEVLHGPQRRRRSTADVGARTRHRGHPKCPRRLRHHRRGQRRASRAG